MIEVIKFDTIDSTNSQAMREDYPHGTVIVALEQSMGRGQRGNSWVSEKGQNLTFSLVIEPTDIEATCQFRISEIAALAAADAIEEYGLECKIKWSNDLYVGDKKIGGILIEHSIMGTNVCRSVIGIGINVNQQKFDPSLPNPTSIAAESIKGCDTEQLLDKFLEHFDRRYHQTHHQLHTDYTDRLWRGEGFHPFCDAEGRFLASIHDIDPRTGQLALKLQDNTLRHYWFKEVDFLL